MSMKSNKYIDDIQKYMFVSKENAAKILQLFEYVLLKNTKEYKKTNIKVVNMKLKKKDDKIIIKIDDNEIEEMQKYVQEHFLER